MSEQIPKSQSTLQCEREVITSLLQKLELPKAILLQLQETCLFNSMVDEAIRDIDDIFDMWKKLMADQKT